jgi:curved DNA-binding protein CbpA
MDPEASNPEDPDKQPDASDEGKMRLITEVWDELSDEEKIEWLDNFLKVAEEQWDDISKHPDIAGPVEDLREVAMQMKQSFAEEEQAVEELLQTQADAAEKQAQLHVVMAEFVKHFENLGEAEWEEMPTENRLRLMDLLNDWNHGGGREEVLSILPIEVRRRYEE